ncbi:hypothetical protein VE04_06078 [Pseudogymnoascus sp. 24MN13]|nr:hypothetical protein VE04_06078 [Pseudogymnoascus sp. 24MN13]
MALLTTAYALATDIRAGISHLETLFNARGEVVLVGHSAGGGLVQIVCDQELARVQALALLAGTPSFGADHVYRAWWTLDPLFLPRMFLRDSQQPRSTPSSSERATAAFFCPSFPIDWVKPFEKLMPEYESLRWPISTMWRGYVDPRRPAAGVRYEVVRAGGGAGSVNEDGVNGEDDGGVCWGAETDREGWV